MPLFGKSTKSPAEVVKSLKESLLSLERLSVHDSGGKKADKVMDDVSKHLLTISSLLFNNDSDSQSDIVLAQMSQEMYNSGLIPALLRNLARMEFEARKETAEIFLHVLRRQIGTRTPTVEYIGTCDDILTTLCTGYQTPDISHNTGHMLRECVVYESLAKIVLSSENFADFFKYIQMAQFDIASDAFSTMKDLLTRHKTVASEHLLNNYESFFTQYNNLLLSDNLVTKLSSLKLLNELLHDRNNLLVMKRYINSEDNVKLIMRLMLDSHKGVQLTAFNIFQIVVSNPAKSEPVQNILVNNRTLLVTYLENLTTKNSSDERFASAKVAVLKKLKELPTIEE